jgi:hypothetical protein
MTLNTPALKVFVDLDFLTDSNTQGLEEGYLVSVQAAFGKPLFFTVHLETGGLYSKIPCSKLFSRKFGVEKNADYSQSELQPWSCLEGPAQCLVIDYLENKEVKAKIGDRIVPGNYVMTVDYHSPRGFADDPEQYKAHHIVVLENGQFAALPNNYLLFTDKFFADVKEFPKHYRRQSKFYFAD